MRPFHQSHRLRQSASCDLDRDISIDGVVAGEARAQIARAIAVIGGERRMSFFRLCTRFR